MNTPPVQSNQAHGNSGTTHELKICQAFYSPFTQS